MKQKDIPIYNDPSSFKQLGYEAKFPCSTQYMVYDALTSRYFLTPQTLEEYGIDPSYIWPNNPKALEQFIEEITEDLYDVMGRLAPFNLQYNQYLVAQSRALQFRNRFAARKQFEKCLIHQAQYKLKTIDVRDFAGIDFDANTAIYHKQLRRELRHISPKALDILKVLGLLFNGDIPHSRQIDYGRFM